MSGVLDLTILVLLFLLLHLIFCSYLVDASAAAAWTDWANICSHLFLLPSLLIGSKRLCCSTVVAGIVSTIYHIWLVVDYSNTNTIVVLQRLDHGTAIGLIATVLMSYRNDDSDWDGPLILLVALSSSLPTGNLISGAAEAMLFPLPAVLGTISSLVLHPWFWRKTVNDATETTKLVTFAFLLQLAAIVTFFLGTGETGEQWHVVWHCFGFLSIYYIAEAIRIRDGL